MKLYLLETYSSKIKFDGGSKIVALTPEACYLLDKAKIKYDIVENFYKEKNLQSNKKKLYYLQEKWLKTIDNFLQNNISELKDLNLKLGDIYLWQFRTYLLDPLFTRCFAINTLLKKLKPTNITFISYFSVDSNINYRFELRNKSYYSRIIPIFANEKNIQFKQIFLKKGFTGLERENTALNFQAELKQRLRLIYKKSNLVKKSYFIYSKYNTCKLKRSSSKKINIMLLKSAYGGADLAAKATRSGHVVYCLSDNVIFHHTQFNTKIASDMRRDVHAFKRMADSFSRKMLTQNLKDNIISRWFNDFYYINVSSIIREYFEHFFLNICPMLLAYFKFFTKFYEKNNIDLVVTPTIATLPEYMALAAASNHANIKTVGIQHGNDLFTNTIWYNNEMRLYDYYICTDKEIEKHLKKICETNKQRTKLFCSDYRLLKSRKANGKNKLFRRTKKIIYVPTVFMGDSMRLGSRDYSDTWYYLFQKKLVAYLSKQKKYYFVWKGLQQKDQVLLNPIPNFIKDHKFNNIEVATNPFIEHLRSADKVIFDYATTGFYESVIAGLPTLALYHPNSLVRKSASKEYGTLLCKFTTIKTATTHIEKFLADNPQKYKKTIKTDGNDIIRVLEKLSQH